MPPKAKYTKEQILEIAVLIVERDGYSALNIRNIAKELGSSTQPIMSCFSTADELKKATYAKADEVLSEYLMKDIGKENESPFDSIGQNYIEFAKTKSNLFSFLYLNNEFKKTNISETSGYEDYIQYFKDNTGLTYRQAKRFYISIWIFLHGLATFISTNSLGLSENETMDYLTFGFNALLEKTINEDAVKEE